MHGIKSRAYWSNSRYGNEFHATVFTKYNFVLYYSSAAWAAANRATGTRNGEQDT